MEYIAIFYNDSFFSLPNFSGYSVNMIYDVARFRGDYYVIGEFTHQASGEYLGILTLQAGVWTPVGNPHAALMHAGCLAIFYDELYVSGAFRLSEDSPGNFIVKWNGSAWDDVGGGTNSQIFKILPHQNFLYAAGYFTEAGGIPVSSIARWDGTDWCALSGIFDASILNLVFFQDTLYVSSSIPLTIDNDSTFSCLAKWNGQNLVPVCGNTSAVKENNSKSPHLLSPNPTTGIISWNTQESIHDVLIFDYQGRLIQSYPNLAQPSLDVSALPPGLYLLKFNMNGATHSSRLIKQ
jgi:hypothetical protein